MFSSLTTQLLIFINSTNTYWVPFTYYAFQNEWARNHDLNKLTVCASYWWSKMFWSRKISLFVLIIPKNLYYRKPGDFFLLPGNKYISQVYLTQNYINKFTQKKEPYLALIQWLLCDAIIPLEGLSPHLKWLKFKFLCLTPEHNFPIMWLSARAAFVNLMLHSSNNFLSDVFSLFTLSHIMSMNITLWFHSVISLFRKFQWLTNFW